jgi:hypothetical protein
MRGGEAPDGTGNQIFQDLQKSNVLFEQPF